MGACGARIAYQPPTNPTNRTSGPRQAHVAGEPLADGSLGEAPGVGAVAAGLPYVRKRIGVRDGAPRRGCFSSGAVSRGSSRPAGQLPVWSEGKTWLHASARRPERACWSPAGDARCSCNAGEPKRASGWHGVIEEVVAASSAARAGDGFALAGGRAVSIWIPVSGSGFPRRSCRRGHASRRR